MDFHVGLWAMRIQRLGLTKLVGAMVALAVATAPMTVVGSPLHDAVTAGDRKKVDELVASDANVDARDSAGRTALHLACQSGNVNMVALLISAGSDTNAADGAGMTPLHVVAENGHVPLTKMLLKHDANVSAHDSRGRTPLHVAALTNRPVVANILMVVGANVRITDNDGKTPLDLAIEQENEAASEAIAARVRAESFERWKQSMAYVEAMNGKCSAVPRRCPDGSFVYEKFVQVPAEKNKPQPPPKCEYPKCPGAKEGGGLGEGLGNLIKSLTGGSSDN